MNEVTESDPEYYLQPEKLEFKDSLNHLVRGKEDLSVVKNEFLSTTPGLNSVHALNFIPIEQIYYYTP